MSDTPSDHDLMARYQRGDSAAFDQLYARHRGGVYRFFLFQCGNAGLADELHADVWLNLVRVHQTYSPDAKFTTWLYTLARNRWIDHSRQNKRVSMGSLDATDDPDQEAPIDRLADEQGETPEQALGRSQLRARLLAAIGSLPLVQREAFLLQQEGDLTLEEIAAATGTNRETVKSRLRYAVGKLRDQLQGLWP